MPTFLAARSLVNEFWYFQVVHKLAAGQPSDELVDGYLHEIAKAYGVPWESGPQVDETVSDLIKVFLISLSGITPTLSAFRPKTRPMKINYLG